jgi:hypothetical protein
MLSWCNSKYYSGNFLGGSEEDLSQESGVLADIRTGHLSDTSLKHYSLRQLVTSFNVLREVINCCCYYQRKLLKVVIT